MVCPCRGFESGFAPPRLFGAERGASSDAVAASAVELVALGLDALVVTSDRVLGNSGGALCIVGFMKVRRFFSSGAVAALDSVLDLGGLFIACIIHSRAKRSIRAEKTQLFLRIRKVLIPTMVRDGIAKIEIRRA